MAVNNTDFLTFERNNDFVKPDCYKRVDELKIPKSLIGKVESSVEEIISTLEYVSTSLNREKTSNLLKKAIKILNKSGKSTNLQTRSELLVAQFLAFKVYDVYSRAHPGNDNLIHAIEQKYGLRDEQLDQYLIILTSDKALKITQSFKDESKLLKKLKKNYADEWSIKAH